MMARGNAMIESIGFRNFRVLRDTVLPLSPVTVIVGPNGSGKSTVALALKVVRAKLMQNGMFQQPEPYAQQPFASLDPLQPPDVSLTVVWSNADTKAERVFKIDGSQEVSRRRTNVPGQPFEPDVEDIIRSAQCFSLNPERIRQPTQLQNNSQLDEDGGGLARVLTHLQDQHPERFDALNQDLHRWLPEFDRVLLGITPQNLRSFLLRTEQGRHPIDAARLSDGTIIAVALLTLAHLSNPPRLIALEEPDRGVHPRLLRDVQDAIYRLAYPEPPEEREPVQVIVTTHSPYFIDLFRDHPEEIVIAEKDGLQAKFSRLVDIPNLDEVLRDSHLGDVWFSGALGGVPTGT
jgi:predicted ATPase